MKYISYQPIVVLILIVSVFFPFTVRADQVSCGTPGANAATCTPSNTNAAAQACPGGGTLQPNGTCSLGYTQLEPIPGLTSLTGSGPGSLVDPNNLHNIINAVFKILITAGALIAVLSLTVSGVQYMISGSAKGKNAGRRRAEAALWGIVLIAASWLILNTINPALLNFSLNPCPAGSSGCTVTNSVPSISSTGGAGQTIQLSADASAQITNTYGGFTPASNSVLLYNNSDASSNQLAAQYKQFQNTCGYGDTVKLVNGTVVGGNAQQSAAVCLGPTLQTQSLMTGY